MKKILIAFGTRPEAIKMAPLVKVFQNSAKFEIKVCITAQHREMLDQVLNLFDIKVDYDLDTMEYNQDLYGLTESILRGMRWVFKKYQPDIVIVHGDTSTTFTVALAAYYEKLSIAHIEAGLRTGNILSPWPEEGYRKLTTQLATYHFAPTEQARNNLLDENINTNSVIVTGNTVIDALFLIKRMIDSDVRLRERIEKGIQQYGIDVTNSEYILVTAHRRENFGQGFIDICNALKTIATVKPKIHIVFPVHLNPNVRKPVNDILYAVPNIYLIEPLEYESFTFLMMHAKMIISDSGGIQEEAPALGKPVLVMRETTERPEAVNAGTVKLVGTDVSRIVDETLILLDDQSVYQSMSTAHNPYGDGKASEKIFRFFQKNI